GDVLEVTDRGRHDIQSARRHATKLKEEKVKVKGQSVLSHNPLIRSAIDRDIRAVNERRAFGSQEKDEIGTLLGFTNTTERGHFFQGFLAAGAGRAKRRKEFLQALGENRSRIDTDDTYTMLGPFIGQSFGEVVDGDIG